MPLPGAGVKGGAPLCLSRLGEELHFREMPYNGKVEGSDDQKVGLYDVPRGVWNSRPRH